MTSAWVVFAVKLSLIYYGFLLGSIGLTRFKRSCESRSRPPFVTRLEVEVVVTPEDQARWEATSPAKVILASAVGCVTIEVIRHFGRQNPTCVPLAEAYDGRGRRQAPA